MWPFRKKIEPVACKSRCLCMDRMGSVIVGPKQKAKLAPRGDYPEGQLNILADASNGQPVLIDGEALKPGMRRYLAKPPCDVEVAGADGADNTLIVLWNVE